eukprot:UN24999
MDVLLTRVKQFKQDKTVAITSNKKLNNNNEITPGQDLSFTIRQDSPERELSDLSKKIREIKRSHAQRHRGLNRTQIGTDSVNGGGKVVYKKKVVFINDTDSESPEIKVKKELEPFKKQIAELHRLTNDLDIKDSTNEKTPINNKKQKQTLKAPNRNNDENDETSIISELQRENNSILSKHLNDQARILLDRHRWLNDKYPDPPNKNNEKNN